MAKTITNKFSGVGENVAGDYIEAFLRDVKNQGMKRISYYKHLEGISNFNDYYAKRENLNDREIIQGENELNLAVELYNRLYAEGSMN
jgi:hypothetical protein